LSADCAIFWKSSRFWTDRTVFCLTPRPKEPKGGINLVSNLGFFGAWREKYDASALAISLAVSVWQGGIPVNRSGRLGEASLPERFCASIFHRGLLGWRTEAAFRPPGGLSPTCSFAGGADDLLVAAAGVAGFSSDLAIAVTDGAADGL